MFQVNISQLEPITAPDYSGSDPASIINDIVPIVIFVAGIFLILYLIVGGLTLMTSQGDPKKIQDAQGKITGALIGLGIVLFAYLIVSFIGNFFGVDQIIDNFN